MWNDIDSAVQDLEFWLSDYRSYEIHERTIFSADRLADAAQALLDILRKVEGQG